MCVYDVESIPKCVRCSLWGTRRPRYLLHACVATRQLLPEVGDVVVVLLQVLLEVVAPEGQQRFFYLSVELWKEKKPTRRPAVWHRFCRVTRRNRFSGEEPPSLPCTQNFYWLKTPVIAYHHLNLKLISSISLKNKEDSLSDQTFSSTPHDDQLWWRNRAN